MYEYRAFCHRVVDGDTFDFNVDLGFKITMRIRVRLKDVDTPEMNSKIATERMHAQAAKDFVEAQLFYDGTMHDKFASTRECHAVIIRTEKDKLGIYGRYTASVELPGGDDLGALLVSNGYEKKAEYPVDTPTE